MTVNDFFKKYSKKIDPLDLELIIAHELKKPREFVLAHPEHEINENLIRRLAEKIARRIKKEPLAYILEHKEFYGLDFKVTKDTLIPRPETELLVDLVLKNNNETMRQCDNVIVDVGTGSGNIIISLAKNLKNNKIKYIGVDISKKALQIARYNAKKNKLNKKIKFLHGNLLDPIIENCKLKIENSRIIILANLPYLSKKIYEKTLPNVKNYEPKSALYSPQNGLQHYEKLFKQTKKILPPVHCSLFLEFSPEQKNKLNILIKKILPSAQIEFTKDLAQKWRVCTIKLP